MNDPITKLFKRRLLTFWKRPELDLHLVLRASRRGLEWLPAGWECSREGFGWDRSPEWDEQRHLMPRNLVFYKDRNAIFTLHDTDRAGYRFRPVSGPILDLIANNEVGENVINLITDFLREGEKIGIAVAARHEAHMDAASRRRASAELKQRQFREKSLRKTLSDI